MKKRSLLVGREAVLEHEECCSQKPDGHKILGLHTFDLDLYPFDPDEVLHEAEVDRRAIATELGKYLESYEVSECDCRYGACVCHISDPREALEQKDMLQAVHDGLVTLNEAVAELGQGFREFLEVEDPELAKLAIAC